MPELHHSGGMPDPSRIGSRRDFAHELTLLREWAGLTVRDVGRALGVPSSTVSGYFAGHYLPPVKPPDLMQKLLSACGVHDPELTGEWLAALSRVRRAPGRRPAGAPVPYRGLASFQPEDADWFYGREALTGVLVGEVRRQHAEGGLLAVVGPSGSGKSSLLRAGLIPALRSGALGVPGSPAWPVLLFTPGARPVHELAGQLAALTGADPGQLAAALLAEPSRGGELARQAARPDAAAAAGGGTPGHGRLVVVADQFEEIFTACDAEPERQAFITALCAAAGSGADEAGAPRPGNAPGTAAAALVVLGLRADFYPHALRYPALVPALQHRQVLVGPMTAAELRNVVTGPARRAKLDIDEGLVEVLLRDLAPAPGHSGPAVAHDAGTLPLLSHALLTTWERSHRGRLTVADYRASGGIQGAVAHTAEQVYGALSPAQQELTRQIFLRLVHVAGDTADTRRRVPRSELTFGHGDAQPVLDVFIGERLITAETDDVGIAHEALLAAWPRLRDWIDNDRAGMRAAGGADGTVRLWDVRRPGHPEALGAPLAASSGSVGSVFSPDGRLLASASADGTVRLWDIAVPGRPERLGRPLLSLTSAVYQVSFSPGGHVLAASGEDHKVRLWDVRNPRRPRLLSVLSGPIGIVYNVAFSPSGHVIATANGDGTVSLWDVADPARPVSIGSLTGFSGAVFAVAFSPSGNTIATGSQDQTARLWFASGNSAARHICSVAGQAITRAEWARYLPGAPYNPPCQPRR